MHKSGIYAITNISNGMSYIGSTNNLARRKSYHYSALEHNRHTNNQLQKAYNKFGKDIFVFEVLEYAKESELVELEQLWLDSQNTSTLYNIHSKAYKRHKQSLKTRQKISNAMKGRKLSKEHINKLLEARKDYPPITQEQRDNMSKAQKGRKFSEKHKQHLRDAWKIRKKTPVSVKTRKKMSESHKNIGKTNINVDEDLLV